MEKPDDFALGDVSGKLCRYCTDASGKILAFDAILQANAGYFKESQGLTEQASLKMAHDLLKSQPAWRNS